MQALRGARVALLASIALSLTVASQASAHGALKSSVPANKSRLARPPAELRLTFTERPALGITRIGLLRPDSQRVALGAFRLVDSAGFTVVAAIEGRLIAGTHTVTWEVAGADGHPVRGTFTFVVDSVDTVRAPMDTTASHHDTLAMPQSATRFDAESMGYVAVRFALYAALLVVIGAVVFANGVLRLLGRRADVDAAFVQDAARRTAAIGKATSWALLAACVARLVAQSLALNGADAMWSADRLIDLVGGTAWGMSWLAQVGLTLVVIAGFTMARSANGSPRNRSGWIIATVGAALLAFSPALASHAAAVDRLRAIAILADGLHVFGAAGWMGALILVLAAGMPAALSLTDRHRAGAVAALINAFSPTALVFATLVALSGLFAAWLHVGGLAELWNSTYGKVLLGKVAAVSLVALIGAYNMFRLKPLLQTGAATTSIRRSATLELCVGVVVLFLTAILVATPPGMDTM